MCKREESHKDISSSPKERHILQGSVLGRVFFRLGYEISN